MKGISPLPNTGHVGFSYVVLCTAREPWDGVARAGVRIKHPDARPVNADGATTAPRECPHCGGMVTP